MNMSITEFEDETFMYILDMCQSLSDDILKSLICNIETLIENRKEEEEDE